MRHAWLIIAHNEFDVLQRLVSELDDERSDFFLHIDAKVKTLPKIVVEKGRLFVLENRVDVRWGSVSQIETELVLLEAALAQGPYSHYHILSGTHLPLKEVSELFRLYDAHPQEEVVRCWAPNERDMDFKIHRYHFPLRAYKSGSAFRRTLCQRSWQAVLKVQKILGIRHLTDQRFYKTDNWLSLTEEASRYLVGHRRDILKKYRWSFCGDEYFAVSELKRSGVPFQFFDCQNLLHVVFHGDTPCTYLFSDIPALKESGCLWARKFTSVHDS